MGTLDFKLELYFNMYKDSPIIRRSYFTKRFIKKHGKFKYLPELILMIERYKLKKYGNLIDYYVGYAPSKKGRER